MTTNVELFTKYTEVCTQAMRENCNAPFYKLAFKLVDKLYSNKTLKVALCSGKTQRSVDFFEISFKNNKCHLKQHSKLKPKGFHWKVNKSYIEHVVKSPKAYIQSPYKIDLDWAKSRLGLETY
ncbi:MAG: hypothetical protein R3B45_05105 [Bdellovibrionota bacterium]